MGIRDVDGNLAHFVVGKVLEAGKHPNADKLQLTKLDNRQQLLREGALARKLVDEAPFQLVAAVIRKLDFCKQYALPANPYDLALEFGLERIYCRGGNKRRGLRVQKENRIEGWGEPPLGRGFEEAGA